MGDTRKHMDFAFRLRTDRIPHGGIAHKFDIKIRTFGNARGQTSEKPVRGVGSCFLIKTVYRGPAHKDRFGLRGKSAKGRAKGKGDLAKGRK